MKPYVKGVGLSVNLWRPHRDEEGWKLHPNSGAYDEDEHLTLDVGREIAAPPSRPKSVREKLLPNQKPFLYVLPVVHLYEPYLYGTGLRSGVIVRVLELIKEAAIFLPPGIAN